MEVAHLLSTGLDTLVVDEVLHHMQADNLRALDLVRGAVPQISAAVHTYAAAYKQGIKNIMAWSYLGTAYTLWVGFEQLERVVAGVRQGFPQNSKCIRWTMKRPVRAFTCPRHSSGYSSGAGGKNE